MIGKKHFPSVLPLPVPNNCHGEHILLEKAGFSLTNVMNHGILRVGVHEKLASYPFIYSMIKLEENTTFVGARSKT
jgi:hypothetical protein